MTFQLILFYSIFLEDIFAKKKDPTQGDEKKEEEGMENWTEEQLREAVDKKHGKEKNKVISTKVFKNWKFVFRQPRPTKFVTTLSKLLRQRSTAGSGSARRA